ncbi:MAG: anthranilate phosphoribosyltransferase [Hyphomonadaceae bacterium]|uniref:anthranilate phosphoribosyltransferase n=1 Tax=Aquidulcibacter sp. TaxID=2052990 RepID=UPI0022C773F8|nr:anthranilate phosphoribosyltransferase [Aquidulcibacter sp.]MCE2889848.1 anthranilate phosphoribosyltransferase [Hyphomonadaceae bacterium]MCZ8208248.1 anthranilate phosphoribosyltransferase [Aquidulcibacter sp.]
MSEAIKPALALLRDGKAPTPALLDQAFAAILSGEATQAQIGAFLMGLERLTLTSDMIASGASAMRAAMTRVETPFACVDVCGTGGDGSHTLNISTAVSFVLAGAGLKVAKHGNRAMSSKSGAADVLEALGVKLELSPAQCAQALDEVGLVFLFAQAHHPAMRHVGPARRELGFRTIFNLLGPLSNPANAQRQLVGVFADDKRGPIAHALMSLGCESAWVVHGHGGLDELSLSGPTHVTALKDKTLSELEIHPSDLGLTTAPLEALKGGDAVYNARALRELLQGETGPYRDVVLLNAAAALVATAAASDMTEALARATTSLDSRAALSKLDQLIAFTHRTPS